MIELGSKCLLGRNNLPDCVLLIRSIFNNEAFQNYLRKDYDILNFKYHFPRRYRILGNINNLTYSEIVIKTKKQPIEFQLIAFILGRPTGIRTPTNGTKNRCATVTPWVCLKLRVQI